MPLSPVGPGRHPLRPGWIRLRGEGDPVKGGVEVGGTQVLAGRHGVDHLPRCMPRTRAGLAPAPCRASRALRALTALTARLPWGPSTTGAPGRLALPLGRLHMGPGRESALAVVPNVGDPAWNATYKQGEVCKAPMEKGGAKMEECNNKTNKFDEIHRNGYEIRTNFMGISHKVLYSQTGIHVNCVRNS